ncbi:AI-2E family transporter [Histophilus somni]|uniref:AI-2E family transporter n=1 Tax=Histophilus somni TaxID=731 RepID=UPI00201F2CA4|nr:AI-2E family transporter [Histophilus somni]
MSERNSSLTQVLVACAAIIVILGGIKLASEIVVPFLLSLFIAIICSPVVNFMTKRKIPHWLAITLLFVLIVVLFYFLASLISNTVQEFTQSIPQYKVLLSQRLNDLLAFAHHFNIPLFFSTDSINDDFDPSIIMKFVSRFLLSFSNVVTNIFVLFLIVVFMLAEAHTVKQKFTKLIVTENTVTQQNYIERILQGVIGYLGVKTITSVMTGLCIYFVLSVLDIQYAILWATLVFLLNYIPNIGSIIAAVPVIVQSFLLNGFITGLVVSIAFILINTVVGNVLEPKMMGRKLGLSTLIVFLSLLFWGWLLGTVGMLLSVPLTMGLKIALEANPNTIKYAELLGDVSDVQNVK